MDKFSKETIKSLLNGGSFSGYAVIRISTGEPIGTTTDIKDAREIQKITKAKTMILKMVTKMTK